MRHLNALHATRQAFVTTESSLKLKLALRKQTRQARDFFEPGSEVYFKRNIDQKWRGSGIATGQDGAVVFNRQGSKCLNDQNIPNIKKGQIVSFSLNDENYIA